MQHKSLTTEEVRALIAKGKLKGALARAFKGAALSIPADLPERIEAALTRAFTDRLGGRMLILASCLLLFAGASIYSQSATFASPREALAAATADADPADRIVVFGSFYTVGGILEGGVPRLQAQHIRP